MPMKPIKIKGKQTKPKPKPTKKKAAKALPIKVQASRSSSSGAMVAHKVCGITDPFCPHAVGAKYPDPSPTRTLAYPFKGRNTLTTESDGCLAIMWKPCYVYYPYFYSNVRTANTVTSWYGVSAIGLISGVTSYRIVSSGFVLKSISAPLYASGMLHLRSWPNADGASYASVDVLNYNNSASFDIPIQDAKEVTVITQHSARMPQLFNIASSDGATLITSGDNGYTPVSIYISGAPANTSMFSMEFFINYELVFNDSEGLSQLATLPAPVDPRVTAIAASVTSNVQSVFHKTVKSAGSFILNKALDGLASYVGGPAGYGAMQMIRNVD